MIQPPYRPGRLRGNHIFSSRREKRGKMDKLTSSPLIAGRDPHRASDGGRRRPMTIPAGQETPTEAPSSRASLQIFLVPDVPTERRDSVVKRIFARITWPLARRS